MMRIEPLFYRPLALDLLYACVLAYKAIRNREAHLMYLKTTGLLNRLKLLP